MYRLSPAAARIGHSHSQGVSSALQRPANGAACFRSVSASRSLPLIRLMQGWRTQFADAKGGGLVPARSLAGFQGAVTSRSASCCCRRATYLVDLRSALRFFDLRSHRGAAPDLCRQHHHRDRRPHLYELVAVLAACWCGRSGFCSTRLGRRTFRRWYSSAIRWCCGRRCRRSRSVRAISSWRGAPMPSSIARVLSRALARLGAAAAHARFHLLLSAVARPRASLRWSMRCARRGHAALAVMGLCGVAALGFAAMLPISAAFIGTSMQTLQPTDALPELDLTSKIACRFRGRRLCRGNGSGHLDAVLVSMFTTWTRRLIGSAPLAVSFSLVLP